MVKSAFADTVRLVRMVCAVAAAPRRIQLNVSLTVAPFDGSERNRNLSAPPIRHCVRLHCAEWQPNNGNAAMKPKYKQTHRIEWSEEEEETKQQAHNRPYRLRCRNSLNLGVYVERVFSEHSVEYCISV